MKNPIAASGFAQVFRRQAPDPYNILLMGYEQERQRRLREEERLQNNNDFWRKQLVDDAMDGFEAENEALAKYKTQETNALYGARAEIFKRMDAGEDMSAPSAELEFTEQRVLNVLNQKKAMLDEMQSFLADSQNVKGLNADFFKKANEIKNNLFIEDEDGRLVASDYNMNDLMELTKDPANFDLNTLMNEHVSSKIYEFQDAGGAEGNDWRTKRKQTENVKMINGEIKVTNPEGFVNDIPPGMLRDAIQYEADTRGISFLQAARESLALTASLFSEEQTVDTRAPRSSSGLARWRSQDYVNTEMDMLKTAMRTKQWDGDAKAVVHRSLEYVPDINLQRNVDFNDDGTFTIYKQVKNMFGRTEEIPVTYSLENIDQWRKPLSEYTYKYISRNIDEQIGGPENAEDDFVSTLDKWDKKGN
jgi:hypothetical protein